MSLTQQQILGINITINSKKEILEYIQKYLDYSRKSKVESRKSRQKPLVIVTPNPEQVVYARNDSHFAGLLNGADIAIPDGIGLVFALRVLKGKRKKEKGKSKTQKISGVELMEDLVAMADMEGFPIGLIGGRGGVALKALECLFRRMPGLAGWAEEPGEISNTTNTTNIKYYQYCRSIIQKIRTTKTRIVFVGLGAPKQEYLIEQVKSQKLKVKSPIIFMSVGGSFDEISGRIPRPPALIDKLGIKWFWRLILEPWRFKRQSALLQFIWMVLRERFMQ